MITAGIHGSEIASILAAQKLTNIQIKRGTIILVPIVNMRAFHRRIRGVPDVNRTFPRTPNDAARGLLAKNLFRLTRHFRPKWVLDLHEAIGFSKIDPRKLGQSILTNPRSMAISTAKRVINHINHSIQRKSRQFTIHLWEKPGTFRTATARLLGTQALTVETSIHLPLSVRVKFQERIVRSFLREAGLL